MLDPAHGSYVFLGEYGSGKTEIALNCALALRRSGREVSFFDMDRTKGLFRARDCEKQMKDSGVRFVNALEFQDAPIVPPGVTSALSRGDTVSVFDVGGNAVGATMIGQYAGHFARSGAAFFYIVNPLRPFSSRVEDIRFSMETILSAARIDRGQVKLISNPCLGPETDAALVLSAHEKLMDMAGQLGLEVSGLAASRRIADELRPLVSQELLPLDLFIENMYKL